ncbi:hypothetical protein KFE94_00155 [bacterium SCSIO 12643]|nr:hypothetical protein KFE94_00155 [bacterium SCSIO 12643]
MSCTKNYDDFGPQTPGGGGEIPQKNQVLILNEGNFMFGNGSISILNSTTDEVAQKVFKSKNGFPLGDVPQSMFIHDSLGYIIVNNSSKIEVVRLRDFSSVKTITGFNSPRYMTVVSENPLIAWVTDLYADKIWKVNLDEGKIIGEIPATGWHENIMKWNNQVIVLRKSDSVVRIIDIQNENAVQTFDFATGVVDFGLYDNNTLITILPEGIQEINLQNYQTQKVVDFVPERNPLKMTLDLMNNRMYFIDKDVFQYDFTSKKIDEKVKVQAGSNFYGILAHPQTGEIFLTDAKDYVQPGEVTRYHADFSDSIVYSVGVNPQHIELY